jgi:mono-ADP-ribosyltransferase sirtuin 6
MVMKNLGLEIPEYENSSDPTRNTDINSREMDWTIPTSRIKEMKILYKKVCTPVKRKRRATFMYEREITKYSPKRKEKKQDFTVKKEDIDNGSSLSNFNNEESNANKETVTKLEPSNDDSNEATTCIDVPAEDSNVT